MTGLVSFVHIIAKNKITEIEVVGGYKSDEKQSEPSWLSGQSEGAGFSDLGTVTAPVSSDWGPQSPRRPAMKPVRYDLNMSVK